MGEKQVAAAVYIYSWLSSIKSFFWWCNHKNYKWLSQKIPQQYASWIRCSYNCATGVPGTEQESVCKECKTHKQKVVHIPQQNNLHQTFTFVLKALSWSHSMIAFQLARKINRLFFLLQEMLSNSISQMELQLLVLKESYRWTCFFDFWSCVFGFVCLLC